MKDGNVLALKVENIDKVSLGAAINLIESGNTEKLKDNKILKSFASEEICLLAEESCRYQREDLLLWIINKHEEILYFYPCDILDIAVATCNYSILNKVLESYHKEYRPILKYKSSCDRAIANHRFDIINALKNRNVIFA